MSPKCHQSVIQVLHERFNDTDLFTGYERREAEQDITDTNQADSGKFLPTSQMEGIQSLLQAYNTGTGQIWFDVYK